MLECGSYPSYVYNQPHKKTILDGNKFKMNKEDNQSAEVQKFIESLKKIMGQWANMILPQCEYLHCIVEDKQMTKILSNTTNWTTVVLATIPIYIDVLETFYHSVDLIVGNLKNNSKQLLSELLQTCLNSQTKESHDFYKIFSNNFLVSNNQNIHQKWSNLNVNQITDFHILLMAHIQRRPIIVAEKDNSAIYLPILRQQLQFVNVPILLAVNNEKYRPLFFLDDGSQDPYKKAVFPLEDANHKIFRTPFIGETENERKDALKKYLFLTKVTLIDPRGTKKEVPAARIKKPRMTHGEQNGVYKIFEIIKQNLEKRNEVEAKKLFQEKIFQYQQKFEDQENVISSESIEMENDPEDSENLYDQSPSMQTNQNLNPPRITPHPPGRNMLPKSFTDNNNYPFLEPDDIVSSITIDANDVDFEDLQVENYGVPSNAFVSDTHDEDSTSPKLQNQEEPASAAQNQTDQDEEMSNLVEVQGNTSEPTSRGCSGDIVHDSSNSPERPNPSHLSDRSNLNQTPNSLNENMNEENSLNADQGNSNLSDSPMEIPTNSSDLHSLELQPLNDHRSIQQQDSIGTQVIDSSLNSLSSGFALSRLPEGAAIVVNTKNHKVVTGVSNATFECPIGLYLRATYIGKTVKVFVRISKRDIPEIFVNVHGIVQTNYSRTAEDKVTMKLQFLSGNTALLTGEVPKVYQIKTNRNDKNAEPAPSFSAVFRHTEENEEDDTATVQNNPLKCKIDGCNRFGVPQNRGLCDSCMKDWQETQASRGNVETPWSDMLCVNQRCGNNGSSEYLGYCESCFNERP